MKTTKIMMGLLLISATLVALPGVSPVGGAMADFFICSGTSTQNTDGSFTCEPTRGEPVAASLKIEG